MNIKAKPVLLITSVIYFPTQIRFPIGGKRVTYRGSELTYSLKKQQHAWTFDSHVIRACSLKLRQAGVKQTISLQFFFYFWVGRYNKTLNDWWPRGKQWVLFPLDIRVPLGVASRSGNTKGLEETVIKCLLYPDPGLCNIIFQLRHGNQLQSESASSKER